MPVIVKERKASMKQFILIANSQNHPLASFADNALCYPGNNTEQDAIIMNIYFNILSMIFCEEN
ncbi:MAG TPA: hypothetical protein DHN33_10255 [Eubacteriaceae bacterium]|nr:hypothetical protein [Eubacteriaceae bacterium]